ncbi:MAG: M6 family metalloprotease domain-containing protein [Bacteroidales bacterium]|nr:M6 family metalloprotease domain-containing protein [Bacteroidales bacterium]
MKRFLTMLIALVAFTVQLWAVKAWPYPVTVTQPDGTSLVIRIHGDENRSWTTLADGRPVFQDSDGFWRVTDSLPSPEGIRKRLDPEGGAISMFFATKSPVRVRTIVIPVQFADRKFTVPSPRAAIYNLFNQQNYRENGATGSVLDYFRDNLGGYGNFTFDVCDVVTLPGEVAVYGANAGGVTDRNIKQLVVHACEAADRAGVDFSLYDFDRDGIVDNVFILFAGHNEAEGGGDNTLWPQSWNISDTGLSLDGMRISNFSLYSEYSGPSGYQFAGIGSICHEYCHFLGLPDLYDVNGETEGAGPGLFGTLSIMDRGNYNNEGRTPPYLTVFERQMLGLTGTESIRNEQELLIPPVQDNADARVISAHVSGEDFWLEYRDGSKWDAHIGGTGLVVYHIDKSLNKAGSMNARMRWSSNAVNGCADHPCARFISSAGGLPSEVGDAFFPGRRGVTAIHSSSNFPLIGWSGKGAGFGLSDITLSSGGIRLNVVADDSWDLPVLEGWSIVPGQTSALLEWQADKQASGQWNLRWGAVNGMTSHTSSVGNGTSYLFEDLEPGQAYFCELWFTQWDKTGRVYRMEFRALNRLTDYPLIGGLDRTWRVGDRFRLFLLNPAQDQTGVTWRIDGESCTEEYYSFNRTGTFRIQATITYSDGSKETLTKILEVKDAE